MYVLKSHKSTAYGGLDNDLQNQCIENLVQFKHGIFSLRSLPAPLNAFSRLFNWGALCGELQSSIVNSRSRNKYLPPIGLSIRNFLTREIHLNESVAHFTGALFQISSLTLKSKSYTI